MVMKIKAREKKIGVGPNAGEYRFVMMAEIYNRLTTEKVIAEASLRSGINRGSLNAAWMAIGEVISAWATEGHSVAIPGLGTMRFGVNATSVAKVEDVSAKLITTRKVIFVPSTNIKAELKATAVNITCYDRNGEVIKQVASTDKGEVEDPEENTTPQETLYTLTWKHGDTVKHTEQLAEGAAITEPAAPEEGYHWKDVPATMPGHALEIVSEADSNEPPVLS